MITDYKSAGELFKHAEEIFPGGTQFLSKQPHRSGCANWPTYYKEAKGIKITDLYGKEYLDFTQLGSGASILGYSFDEVNRTVIDSIHSGSMTSLNVPEEIELAELLLELHPWSGFVKYARTGAEIVSVAVRIARAYSKKSLVMFCGYHGWHDWYVAANLRNVTHLDNHLFQGLEPHGIPQDLIDTSIPFNYNDTESFQELFDKNKENLAAIIMEPTRFDKPNKDFLKTIREKTSEYNIPLIFDEITCGWRQTNGGVHLLGEFANYVTPDLAVYSKAVANGYPFACLLSSKKLFEAAKKCFLSSTLWTEKIGTTAAMATIKFFLKENVVRVVSENGIKFRNILDRNCTKYGFDLIMKGGIEALTFFTIKKNGNVLNSIISKKMLERGVMLTSAFYPSYSHDAKHFKLLDTFCDEIFKEIGEENEI